MVSFDAEKQTIGYYDRKAETWIATHGGYEGKSWWENEMRRFHELLPKGKILEIGSGAGRDAAALIAMGYDYIGIDASKSMIEIAKKRNPNATFHCISVYDLDFPTATFDGFWTAATLLHLPKPRIKEALDRIKQVLKPAGIGFISMKQGEGQGIEPGTGRWFAYYSEEEFKEVLETSGFEVIETQIRPEEENTWLVFYVKA